MVHLRSIRIRGFKTFAKPTELLLEPGVTVIIGPNGSGKSNIADAVLWVLGEQSPGNLRGRTMQDVMFSGADGKKQSSVAEVSLVFDNGCGTLPFDCSELEVTRRLSKDTGSDYRLNGSGCRLLDIQDVVGQLGLGREMHSVISQGKVESLLNSSAEARRAMVEEAAGLGRFKKRRERAQSKLERATQNLVRARDIEQEVRTAMRPLRQQVAAAERFAEATEEWATAKGRELLHALTEVQECARAAESELEQIDGDLVDVGGRIGELRRQRTAEEESLNLGLMERERLGGLFHKARAAAEYLESRAATLRQRLARAEGDLERAKRRFEMAKNDLSFLGDRMAEVMTGSIDETRLNRVAQWSESLRASLDEALPDYQAAARKEDDLKDRVFESEAARSRAVQDREFLRREQEQRGRLTAELAGLVRQTEARVRQLATEGEELAASVAQAEESLRDAESEVLHASQARDEALTKARESARAEAGLAELLAGLESREVVLRGVLERKEGLPAGARELLAGSGEYKSLAELLVVQQGYERAVAAALGATVQAVVVPRGEGLGEALRAATGSVEVIGASDEISQATEIPPPPGTKSLWDVVSGPATTIAALRMVLPQTFVVDGGADAEADDETLERLARDCTARLVNRAGEILQGDVYAARRREVGGESLLAAGNELESVAREYETLSAERSEALKAAERATAEAAEAEALLRQQEERVREAEHRRASSKSEADLCSRRLEESEAHLEELRERSSRETEIDEGFAARLAAVGEVVTSSEADLEDSRASLRELQSQLETMRGRVAQLEERKGRAALVEVKLRERCRNLANERARVEEQRQSAAGEVAKWEKRVAFLEGYAPVVAQLLHVSEDLAEKGRAVAADLSDLVEASRTQTEGTTRSMRDWGAAEVGLQREYESMSSRLTEVRIEQTRLEDRKSQLEAELGDLRRRHLGPRQLEPVDVAGADSDSLAAAVERAERRRDRIGPVNPLAEHEYAQMAERAEFLAEQRADLETAVGQLEEVITGLDEHIEHSFNEVFEAAKQHFEAVIAVVFPGAKGSLRLTEARPAVRAVEGESDNTPDDLGEGEQDTPARGVTLEVKFANKAPRSLSLLSGGEKAMTAIAFLFSLFLAKPCPFYILDEVEASLDDINIRRFLSLVEKYRDKTQFIVITHQRQTMEVADTLYGVALESDGTSRLLSRKMAMAKGA